MTIRTQVRWGSVERSKRNKITQEILSELSELWAKENSKQRIQFDNPKDGYHKSKKNLIKELNAIIAEEEYSDNCHKGFEEQRIKQKEKEKKEEEYRLDLLRNKVKFDKNYTKNRTRRQTFSDSDDD